MVFRKPTYKKLVAKDFQGWVEFILKEQSSDPPPPLE